MVKAETKENFDKIKLIFMCLLIAYLTVREISPLHFLISSPMVSAAVFACGFLLILCGAFISRTLFVDRRTDVLALFFAVTLLSCVINFRYGYADNVKSLGAMLMFFFLFFESGAKKTKEQRKHEIDVITAVLCIVWAVFVVVSIVMFCFSIFYVVNDGSYCTTSQGFNRIIGRLWGVFQDPNYAGYVSDAVILFSVRFIINSKKKSIIVINVLNILLEFAFLSLGGSLSAIIIFVAVVILYVFYMIMSADKEKNIRKIVKSTVAAVLCGVLCYGIITAELYVMPLAQTAVSKLPERIPMAVTSAFTDLYESSDREIKCNASTYKKTEKKKKNTVGEPVKRKDRQDDEDISHGRFDRWKQTLDIFITTPIVGTSPRNLSSYAQVHLPETYMAKYDMAPHNGYLDILVGTGVVGLAVFLLFLIPAIIAIIKKYFKFESDGDFIISVAVVFIYVVAVLFVSDLFFMISVGAFMFWTFLGYALHSDEASCDKKGVLMRIYEKIFLHGRSA